MPKGNFSMFNLTETCPLLSLFPKTKMNYFILRTKTSKVDQDIVLDKLLCATFDHLPGI